MIDRLLAWSVHRLARRTVWLQERWYRAQFEADAKSTLSSLVLADGLRMHVPVRVAGGRGRLEFGERVVLGYSMAPRCGQGEIMLQPRAPEATIAIGTGTWFSNNVSIVSMGRIDVGHECLIGDLVQVFDCDFHCLKASDRARDTGPIRPVVVGNSVWLGSRVLVLKGVTIGDNSVIGAGSVVVNSIAANCLPAGIPAKAIRNL